MDYGFHLVSGGTDNHLLLVNLTSKNITGKEAEKRLDSIGITCNKNAVPFDKESPFVTSGIRLGSPAMTTRGFNEEAMRQVAKAIDLTISYGEDEAKKARDGARAVFGGGDSMHMPTTEIVAEDLTDGAADILTLLVLSGLCPSKSDARRNVQQGGVTADEVKVEDVDKTFSREELKAGVILRRGKKSFNKVVLKS